MVRIPTAAHTSSSSSGGGARGEQGDIARSKINVFLARSDSS